MKTKIAEIKSHSAFYLWAFGLTFAVCFTSMIWFLGPGLKHFVVTFIPRNDASWYFWKLPSRDSIGMAVAWILYLGHQFSVWGSIYLGQRNLMGFRSDRVFGLPKYSLVVTLANVVFTLTHLIQTHVWFDGLAQDTPILTSQGSVIVMLAIVLILENPRRGIFLGRKAGRPFSSHVVAFFRRRHMYVIAWALVYTFWFHPMATDPQLLSGFFYMFLLFTQVSSAWTGLHTDRRWIVMLESYVAIHALIVAFYNTSLFGGPVMWPMFLSGFAFMFVFTYMFAFKARKSIYLVVTTLYAGFLAWLYLPTPIGFGRSLVNLLRLEFLWIPIILYGLAALFAGLAYFPAKARSSGITQRAR